MTDSPPRPGRPKRFLVGWVATSCVIGLVAFVVGGLMRSPWEGAVLNSSADPAVTAQVSTREFSDTVATATGTASAGVTTDVVPIPPASGRAVVTAVHASAGSVLRPGHALADVSGRPLVALALPFDLYRDLAPGDSGPDVEALQQALADAGLSTGAVDGTFGPRTSAAIRALYAQSALASPEPSTDSRAALDSALADLRDASLRTSHEQAPPGLSTASDDAAPDVTPDLDDGPDVSAPGAADEGAEQSAGTGSGTGGAATDTSAELAERQRAVDEARLAADTPLPMAEIIRVPAPGVDVLEVAPVGTSLTGEETPVATLRLGSLSATARVGVDDAEAFLVDAAVTVTPTTGGPDVGGVISTVGDFQGAGDEGQLPGFDLTVAFPPDTTGLDDGAAVLVRPAGATPTRAGLAVPLVAVRTDGAQAYLVVVTGATTRSVDITMHMSSDGFALVSSDDLHDGDSVLISGVP